MNAFSEALVHFGDANGKTAAAAVIDMHVSPSVALCMSAHRFHYERVAKPPHRPIALALQLLPTSGLVHPHERKNPHESMQRFWTVNAWNDDLRLLDSGNRQKGAGK